MEEEEEGNDVGEEGKGRKMELEIGSRCNWMV